MKNKRNNDTLYESSLQQCTFLFAGVFDKGGMKDDEDAFSSQTETP